MHLGLVLCMDAYVVISSKLLVQAYLYLHSRESKIILRMPRSFYFLLQVAWCVVLRGGTAEKIIAKIDVTSLRIFDYFTISRTAKLMPATLNYVPAL